MSRKLLMYFTFTEKTDYTELLKTFLNHWIKMNINLPMAAYFMWME
jgi:hypothetical protein